MTIPNFGEPLSDEQLALLGAVSQACRRSIIEMTACAQSGHPGGSLSVIDYLTLLYTFVISQHNDPVVVSNGHVSPAVYAVLGELGVVDKERAVTLFRKPTDVFEGHVNRRVRGVHYSTGPLGVGASVASAFALGNQLSKKMSETVYLLMGDGEQQEGQAYEMMNFAHKYRLSNLVLFVDYNQIQLSSSLEEIMPINIAGHYRAAGWEVIEVDGHDYQAMWNALGRAKSMQMNAGVDAESGRPVCLLAKTVMGKGVSFMEEEASAGRASWHGSTTNKELTEKALAELVMTEEDKKIIQEFLASFAKETGTAPLSGLAVAPPSLRSGVMKEKIFSYDLIKSGTPVEGFDAGEPREYGLTEKTDCRSAYGNALVDLAGLNMNVVALTADLAGSVKTDGVKKAFPERHIECGISEQHMVSAAGGLSLRGFIPFASTFGAFMSSRAKDQARVNDINETNVKMVATHCGLSVGEDGPTHQAIDDISSFLGMYHTSVLEPADPNQCDRMIRAIAGVYGNFYVRMGRAKVPTITREVPVEPIKGKSLKNKQKEEKALPVPFFGGDYVFEIGRADVVRTGKDVTIVASGPMVAKAIEVRDMLRSTVRTPTKGSGKASEVSQPSLDVEIIAVNSLKPFDHDTLVKSAKKTGRVLTLEDHNVACGLGMLVTQSLEESGVCVPVTHMGVRGYQLSGTADELYEIAGLGVKDIKKAVEKLATK